jgi:hypothetical protein
MEQNSEKDQWDLALDKELEKITSCQKEQNVDTCTKCEKVLNCDIKDIYVKAVYESMNKGSGGGFEF